MESYCCDNCTVFIGWPGCLSSCSGTCLSSFVYISLYFLEAPLFRFLQPIITSKSKRNAVRFQLCRLRKSAGERRRHEQELSNRLAALELRLRDIDDEVISSSESNRRPDERKFGARADHKVPRMATREIERRSLRKPKEICAIDRSTVSNNLRYPDVKKTLDMVFNI